jgi:nucleoside 2-deoxyribosyltransferase
MENILKGTRVYLAGNMEYNESSAIHDWRADITNKLSKMGIICLSPTEQTFVDQPEETDEQRAKLIEQRNCGNLQAVHEYMVPVVQKDLRLVDICDFFIAVMNPLLPTFGTMHELVAANTQKKPMFISVGDVTKTPLWNLGVLKPQYFYNSYLDIVDTLTKIDSGEMEIDSNRWRLLKSEYRHA